MKTCCINATNRASATLFSLNPEARLINVDFSLAPGGAISGQVLRDSDKSPIQNAYVYAFDKSWNSVSSARTDANGLYIIKSLPSGSYFVRTANGLGITDEYYKDVTT